MKKKCCILSLLIICFSCTETDEFPNDLSLPSSISTRAAGDGEYDVLGYGYDVTAEYLHPMAVRNPILDIKKYKEDYETRIITGTSSYGYDQMYYGYSAMDYIYDIMNETKVSASAEGGKLLSFSGNITQSNYLKTEYAYSNKYSFASVDAVRNRKYIRINDEISRLSAYLSKDFVEDLDRLSPDRIVERYGTHILTDFVIGGRYKLMFRSIITNTKDATHKKKAVASGLTSTLLGIGFSLNISRNIEIDESLVKNNQSKELYVSFYGGNGTSIKYDLEKGIPTSIDLQNWENTVTLGNACLNEIKWSETHPIYDLISDPIKKEKIKQAVEKYITLSKFNELKLRPLYCYYWENGKSGDHFTTTIPNLSEQFPSYKYFGIEGYVLEEPLPGTIPLFMYYNGNVNDHYTTVNSVVDQAFPSYQKWSIEGYVYPNGDTERIPLYEYYSESFVDHYTTTIPNLSQLFPSWVRLSNNLDCGYIYPAN